MADKVLEVVERTVIGVETHITYSEFLLDQRRALNCRCSLLPLPPQTMVIIDEEEGEHLSKAIEVANRLTREAWAKRRLFISSPKVMEGFWAPAMIVDGVMPESAWPLDDPEPDAIVEVR